VPHVRLVREPLDVVEAKCQRFVPPHAGERGEYVSGYPKPPISFAVLISFHVCSGVGGMIWRDCSGGSSMPKVESRKAMPRRSALGPFLPVRIVRSRVTAL